MPDRQAPALDRAGRRRALRSGALAIGVTGAADVVLSGGEPVRAAVWGGWVALYLGAALVIERGPPRVTHVVSAFTAGAPLLALFALAATSSGSHSLYFLVATMVPVLSVLFSPDDTVGAALQGLVVLALGTALQVHEGQALPRLILYGLIVTAVTAAAIHASVGHLRRVEVLLAERARLAQRQVELEQERQRADQWASVGLLSEAVAHDVNSPLGSLRSNLAFVREELAAGRGGAADVQEALLDSQGALERIRETVASLRAVRVLPEGAEPGAPPPPRQPAGPEWPAPARRR